jgi:hypothetical protein
MTTIFQNGAAFVSAVIAAATAAGKVRLFVDVEAAGLHAAGTAPISFSYDAFIGGEHVASYVLACEEGEAAAKAISDAAKTAGQFDFFGTNVLNKMDDMPLVPTCRDLRDAAWEVWSAINSAKDVRDPAKPWIVEKTNFVLEIWGDVVFPVETNFFSACVADGGGSRDWTAPCPLLDVASVLAASGFDAFNLSRFDAAGMDKGRQHHPFADNVASHAVLVMALDGTLAAEVAKAA